MNRSRSIYQYFFEIYFYFFDSSHEAVSQPAASRLVQFTCVLFNKFPSQGSTGVSICARYFDQPSVKNIPTKPEQQPPLVPLGNIMVALLPDGALNKFPPLFAESITAPWW